MNFLKVVVELLESIKGFTSKRFYFIVVAGLIYALAILFKAQIKDAIMSSPIRFEFRECRNEQGLKTALDRFVKSEKISTSYAVYLYQPKNKAVYKTCVVTNNEMLRMSPSLKYMYLKDQPALNTALAAGGYVIIQRGDNRFDTRVLSDFNIDTILVYKIESDGGIIGEIIISLVRPPSAYELDCILRKLGPLCRNYIL